MGSEDRPTDRGSGIRSGGRFLVVLASFIIVIAGMREARAFLVPILLQIQQQIRSARDHCCGSPGIARRRQRTKRIGKTLRSQILLPKTHRLENYLRPAGTYR